MKRLAGSLTLAALALMLLALPLVIGAMHNVDNDRFTGLMLAALVACMAALVLSRMSHRLLRAQAGTAPDAVHGASQAGMRDQRRR